MDPTQQSSAPLCSKKLCGHRSGRPPCQMSWSGTEEGLRREAPPLAAAAEAEVAAVEVASSAFCRIATNSILGTPP